MLRAPPASSGQGAARRAISGLRLDLTPRYLAPTGRVSTDVGVFCLDPLHDLRRKGALAQLVAKRLRKLSATQRESLFSLLKLPFELFVVAAFREFASDAFEQVKGVASPVVV